MVHFLMITLLFLGIYCSLAPSQGNAIRREIINIDILVLKQEQEKRANIIKNCDYLMYDLVQMIVYCLIKV